jgi:16S rRNA (guanine966-N2)-methyltransferase
LAYHGDPLTRPMKDRVREAVFNLLWPAAEGAIAIDLFAGTGALGLEALSRGAVAAWLVEYNRMAAKAIRDNVETLQVADVAQVIVGDTFAWVPQAVGGVLAARPEPWVVFCSPPYEFYVSRHDELLKVLQRLASAAPMGSTMIVESDDRFDPAELTPEWEWDVRRYPPAVVAVGRKPSS